MKTIFRYPGGKSRSTIQQWILDQRPAGITEYREPFVGGGGIFFALAPHTIERRWINDVNAGLIAVYQALASRPEELIAACKAIPPASPDEEKTAAGVKGGLPQNKRLKEVFDSLCLNEQCDQALRYFFVNRTVFGGRVNYDRPSRLYFSKPAGWDIVKGKRLEQAAEWIKGTRVTCGDFASLFTEPGVGVWIYADPPYHRNSGFTGNSKLYQHSFGEEDHRRLAEVVKYCPHKVCLSYDDTPFIRELYPESDGFFVVEGEWAYCGSSNKQKSRGREILILNYEPQGLFNRPQGMLVPQPAPLSAYEEEQFATIEGEISASLEDGCRAFVRLGNVLRLLQQFGTPKDRLYRHHAPTFEAYVLKRWGISKPRLFQFIDAAAAVALLEKSTIVDFSPTHESQVRHLARLRTPTRQLDPNRIAAVWQRAVERAHANGQAVTEAIVKDEVQTELGQQPSGQQQVLDIDRILQQITNLGPDKRQQLYQEMKKRWPELRRSGRKSRPA